MRVCPDCNEEYEADSPCACEKCDECRVSFPPQELQGGACLQCIRRDEEDDRA